MLQRRIEKHPVLKSEKSQIARFTFNGNDAEGIEGEAVSSSLFAMGVQIFGHHEKDNSPQGMFCANGQCSQCTLMIDGVPRKSCIVQLREGMEIHTLDGLPLLGNERAPEINPPKVIETSVLILGAGPSGMAAAIELGRADIDTVIVDDKDRAGGKLVLQTHKFFGSVADCHAGTRGIDIGNILAGQIKEQNSVDMWLESTVLGVFSDGIVGVRTPTGYRMVKPQWLLTASGAREKSLPFPGCTLPGVYGAGAFQTLVNRDLVKCADRVFILGGGNVGLIGAYHAIQAGMTVVGLAEALPVCGGYKVHADKIKRLGVPIHTCHTITCVHGEERAEAVTIAEIDESFTPIAGTERTFAVDTVLIAVGLNSVNEFHEKAVQFGMNAMMAGDAEEIAEASAAMFSGKIAGLKIARELGASGIEIPSDLSEKAEILKSPGGEIFPYGVPKEREGVFPVLHCTQEIPCNPCMTCCPKDLINTQNHPILGNPVFSGECVGCEKCVIVCPGLAITLVDFRKNTEKPVVTIPYELGEWHLNENEEMTVTDWEGDILGTARLTGWKTVKAFPKTTLIKLEVSPDIAASIAGVMVQKGEKLKPIKETYETSLPDTAVVCRCERVTAGEIRELVRSGIKDLNHLKVLTRVGFGACGGKTCKSIIIRICREEGLTLDEITDFTERPLFAETVLGYFAGEEEPNGKV